MRKKSLDVLNGRATGAKALVKNKTAHVLSASNHWSVTENNKNNTWNVNFNNGNTNNNNKYNSHVGRALAALGTEELISWIEAADDCCRNKKTSRQCTLFRLHQEEVLPMLAVVVKDRTYLPQASECFIVLFPKLREIFAAHFLDRVVQHWITLRIEPLLEELFISTGDVSFNCRKGYGTLRAIRKFASDVEEVTCGWAMDAHIGRYDILSFFMSINKNRLWGMLETFIKERYHGDDKDTLLWLSEITVKHRPQDNCIRKGDLSLWYRLPSHKSLFTMDGMAIGNITSQLLANFFLNPFDAWAVKWCMERGGRYCRFVDDMVIILPRKEDVVVFSMEARIFLERELGLTLHADKVYIQHASKGVKFIGAVIKPGRTYLSNRTVGRMVDMLRNFERTCASVPRKGADINLCRKLEQGVSSCNSYMGFLIHHATYGLRRRVYGEMKSFWRVAFASKGFGHIVLRKKFKLKTKDYGNKIFK